MLIYIAKSELLKQFLYVQRVFYYIYTSQIFYKYFTYILHKSNHIDNGIQLAIALSDKVSKKKEILQKITQMLF
jgi:hypothetical protein